MNLIIYYPSALIQKNLYSIYFPTAGSKKMNYP